MKTLIMTVAIAAMTITACSPQDKAAVASPAPVTTVTESVLNGYVPPVIERIEELKNNPKPAAVVTPKPAAVPKVETKVVTKPAAQPKKEVAIKSPTKKSTTTEQNLINHMVRQGVSKTNAKKYATLVVKHSKTYGVDPYTILAMIQIESNYNPNAVGSSNDTGLMQVLPATQKYMKIGGNLFNPSINIEIGSKYLAYNQKKFGEKLGIVAYNQGEGNVRRGTYKTHYLTKVESVKATIKR